MEQPPQQDTARGAPFKASPSDAWDAFRVMTGSTNRGHYERSYLGSWATRAAFGSSLLEEFGAAERLRALPRWLQPYVQLEPLGIVHDFEAAGYYQLAELPGAVHVFDRQALDARVSQLQPKGIQ